MKLNRMSCMIAVMLIAVAGARVMASPAEIEPFRLESLVWSLTAKAAQIYECAAITRSSTL